MPRLTPESEQERRRHILGAATRCFERQGFHATTIPDICAEAGVSTGAVYTWFAGKAEIVAALAEEAGIARGELLGSWTDRATLAGGLGEIVPRLAGSTDAILDVHLWSGALTDDSLRRLAVDSFDTTITAMAEAWSSPTYDGDPRAVAALLVATVTGLEVLGAVGAADTDAAVREFRRQLARIGSPEDPTGGDPAEETTAT